MLKDDLKVLLEHVTGKTITTEPKTVNGVIKAFNEAYKNQQN